MSKVRSLESVYQVDFPKCLRIARIGENVPQRACGDVGLPKEEGHTASRRQRNLTASPRPQTRNRPEEGALRHTGLSNDQDMFARPYVHRRTIKTNLAIGYAHDNAIQN
jgi:hypothetical protein